MTHRITDKHIVLALVAAALALITVFSIVHGVLVAEALNGVVDDVVTWIVAVAGREAMFFSELFRGLE